MSCLTAFPTAATRRDDRGIHITRITRITRIARIIRIARSARIARIALTVTGAAAGLSAATRAAEAQTAQPHRSGWEFIVNNGTVVPTGDQRDAIARGKLTAAQLSYVMHASLAVTATVGWARSRDIASVNDPKLDVFTYDLGAEVRAPHQPLGRGLTVRPFAGIGAGARSYNYRSLDVDATHNLAAYASVGGEVGVRRVRLRVEARDYVTGFKPLAGNGPSATRNDVAVMVGLRLTSR